MAKVLHVDVVLLEEFCDDGLDLGGGLLDHPKLRLEAWGHLESLDFDHDPLQSVQLLDQAPELGARPAAVAQGKRQVVHQFDGGQEIAN